MTISVGDGITYYCGSDCYPYTVVFVKSERCLVIQRDESKRIDNNGYGGQQEWQYSPNPDGSTETITLRKNGRWYKKGYPPNHGLGYGFGRRRYIDPSF